NLESHHSRAARVHVLGEALDGTTLARSISTFEENDDLLAIFFHPCLQLQQLNLQLALLTLVFGGTDFFGVRVALAPRRIRPVILRTLAATKFAGQLADLIDLWCDVDLPCFGREKFFSR